MCGLSIFWFVFYHTRFTGFTSHFRISEGNGKWKMIISQLPRLLYFPYLPKNWLFNLPHLFKTRPQKTSFLTISNWLSYLRAREEENEGKLTVMYGLLNFSLTNFSGFFSCEKCEHDNMSFHTF